MFTVGGEINFIRQECVLIWLNMISVHMEIGAYMLTEPRSLDKKQIYAVTF